jgi:hypothetical protein
LGLAELGAGRPAAARANINLTAIMIGEHISDWMRDEA